MESGIIRQKAAEQTDATIQSKPIKRHQRNCEAVDGLNESRLNFLTSFRFSFSVGRRTEIPRSQRALRVKAVLDHAQGEGLVSLWWIFYPSLRYQPLSSSLSLHTDHLFSHGNPSRSHGFGPYVYLSTVTGLSASSLHLPRLGCILIAFGPVDSYSLDHYSLSLVLLVFSLSFLSFSLQLLLLVLYFSSSFSVAHFVIARGDQQPGIRRHSQTPSSAQIGLCPGRRGSKHSSLAVLTNSRPGRVLLDLNDGPLSAAALFWRLVTAHLFLTDHVHQVSHYYRHSHRNGVSSSGPRSLRPAAKRCLLRVAPFSFQPATSFQSFPSWRTHPSTAKRLSYFHAHGRCRDCGTRRGPGAPLPSASIDIGAMLGFLRGQYPRGVVATVHAEAAKPGHGCPVED